MNETIIEVEDESVKSLSFFEVFYRSLAFFMSLLITYSVVYIAYCGRVQRTVIQLNGTGSADNQFVSMSEAHTSSSSQTEFSDNDNSGFEQNSGAGAAIDLSKAPQTTGEILAFYKLAHSKVKNESKTVTKVYENVTNYQNVLETGNSIFLSKLAKSIMSTFVKENTQAAVFADRESIQANFPPAGAGCNLSEKDIAAAKCTDKGGYYEVEIHTKPELDPQPGSGAGAISTIITNKEINDAVEGYIEISDVSCQYDDVYIIAEIEKSTGNMTYEYVHMPLFLSLRALNLDCRVGLLFESKWEIAW